MLSEINRMLDQGVIECSFSEWCSPIVPVANPDGSVRVCVDFRSFNVITPLKRHYLPTLDDLWDRAGNCKVMSTLDLTSGFHQIEMDEHSKNLSSFGCPQGCFRFKRMPFGLKNAPAVFQQVLKEVLRDQWQRYWGGRGGRSPPPLFH